MTKTKIVGLDEVSNALEPLRANGQKVVLCHGVFDLLHLGHLRYFEAAKRHGDVLVVTLTADEYVNKGPGRPVFSAPQRAQMLAALDLIDFVSINNDKIAVNAIKTIRPDFYAKGRDYASDNLDVTGNISKEKQAVVDVGGSFVVIDEETFSSSSLINEYLTSHEPSTSQWLFEFKRGFSEFQIVQALEQIKTLKVLVLGEAIIDEYMMCEALGKSSKDPVLAFREVRLERQLGGSLAIASHCAGLGAQVTLCTEIGEEPGFQDLITSQLVPEINLKFVKTSVRPTIVKRRYVDESSMQRVFETYQMSADAESSDVNLARHLQALLRQPFDLILICDYGHGFFSGNLIAELVETGHVLAVNTQANAGNRGFNTIGKYPRADFVCLNGGELALELRRKHATVDDLVPGIQERLATKSLIVTEGADGVLICPSGGGSVRVPAFAPFVRDRVGAGDALFAVTSLTQALGAAPEITGFWGNLAGAAAVAQLGNREPINHADLLRHAISILK